MEERLKEALVSLFTSESIKIKIKYEEDRVEGEFYHNFYFSPKNLIGDGSFSFTIIEKNGELLLADYCADTPDAKPNPDCPIDTL